MTSFKKLRNKDKTVFVDWCEEYLSHSKNNEILIEKPTSRSMRYNNKLITIRCPNLENAML